MTPQEKQLKIQELQVYNNFLESPAGKQLLSDLKRKINSDLKELLAIISEEQFKISFFSITARLKANMEVYKTHTGVKDELIILQDSLEDEELL